MGIMGYNGNETRKNSRTTRPHKNLIKKSTNYSRFGKVSTLYPPVEAQMGYKGMPIS